MTLVKVLWIAVGVIWAGNLVLSLIARRKAAKAARAAAQVTVEETPPDVVTDET